MVTFFCVWTGDKYGPEYPERLGRAIAHNLPEDLSAELVCITDHESVPAPWQREQVWPFLTQEEGCWHKLQLFTARRGLCVYLDLDVVVVGDLSWAYEDAKFANALCAVVAMPDPLRRGKFNSSYMAWGERSDVGHVWQRRQLLAGAGKQFGKPTGPWRGDQDFLLDSLPEWCPARNARSYKADLQPKRVDPTSGTVAVFHGTPKPSDLKPTNAYRQIWETGTWQRTAKT